MALAYDGTDFQGWQIQEGKDPYQTIQGASEAALFAILGEKIRITGSGRTDAGVSATGQIAHFDADAAPGLDFRRALNSHLPKSIRVLAVAPASPSFHARKSALYKTYTYLFWRDPIVIPPFAWRVMYPAGPLDAEKMRVATAKFVGVHDFASFQNAGTPQKSTVRTVYSIFLKELPPVSGIPPHIPPLALSVTANGFLKQMARNIAGFLAEAGKGRVPADSLPGILAARDRSILKTPTAPPQGLTLSYVAYPPKDSFFLEMG